MSTAWTVRRGVPGPPSLKGWEVRRVRDLVHLTNGNPFSSEEFLPSGEIPLVRIRDILADGFETYLSGPVADEFLVRDGDVVVGMDGDFNLTIWNKGKAALNQRVCLLRPREDVDIRFIAYALPEILRIINDLTFSTTVKHLSSGEILSEKLAIPSFSEQRRIADFLDVQLAGLEGVVDKRVKQCVLLESRRWAVLQERVRSAEARLLPLRRTLLSLIDGPFGSAFSSSDYRDEGASVVRLGNIGFAEYRSQDQARIPLGLYRELASYAVRPGDLLIAGLGDAKNHAGRACVAPDLGPAIVKGKCFRGRVDPCLSSAGFIALLLASPIGAAAMEGRGSTRSMINLDIVKSAPFPIPPLSEQASILEHVDREHNAALRARASCLRHIQLLNERREALVTAAVTGQIDVSAASGRGI